MLIKKPHFVNREVFNKKEILYVIVSSNSFTYHHFDRKFRYRRVKDERKYTFKSKKLADRVCKALNKLNYF